MIIQVIIDRIEDNGLAVLEIEGQGGDFYWPVEFLPSGIHDGSVLRFRIESNPEEESRRREKIRRLQQELLKRDSGDNPAPR